MPTAPNVPGLVPNIAPSAKLPEINLPVPVDAFGGAVGHALEGLGSTIEQGSDRIWQQVVNLQNLQNETDARNADAQYMMESGKLHADFINKEGVNAGPEALSKHIQDLQDLRTNLRAGLNPRAAQMYDASSLSFMGRNIFNAAGHSGQQMKVASNNAATAQIDQSKTAIGDDPGNNTTFSTERARIESAVDRQAANGGWTPEQTAATKEAQVSEAVAHRALGLSKTNAIGAQRLLDSAVANKAIRPGDAEKVQASITSQYNDQGTRFITDKVLADRREGEDEDATPVQTYLDRAMEEADKLNPPNADQFKDILRQRVVAQYNRQRSIERDADNANTTVIGQALMKANAEGLKPSSIEELKATDPKVAAAWEQLGRNPRLQQQVLKQLDANAKGEHVPLTPENMQEFHTQKGRAMFGTDEERAAFMAKNWATEGKLTLSQRNQLLNLQESLRKQSEADPRVIRAVRMLQPDMQAAGISRSGDGKLDYYSFVGSLQDQLDAYGKEHPGKTPSFEEVKTMGAQLMQEQVASKGIFWDDKEPLYKLPVPEEEATRLRQDPHWAKKGVVPNDAMIARIYRAQVFNEKFKGAAKKQPDAQFPPNAPSEAGGE